MYLALTVTVFRSVCVIAERVSIQTKQRRFDLLSVSICPMPIVMKSCNLLAQTPAIFTVFVYTETGEASETSAAGCDVDHCILKGLVGAANSSNSRSATFLVYESPAKCNIKDTNGQYEVLI